MKFNNLFTLWQLWTSIARAAILAQGRPSKLCHSMFSIVLYKLAVRHYLFMYIIRLFKFSHFCTYFHFLNNACSRLTSNKEYRHTQTKSAWFTVISLQRCMHARYESCRNVADGTNWRSAVKQRLKTDEDSLKSKLLTAAIPSHLRPHIDVTSATKAVTPAFVSSATIDAAGQFHDVTEWHFTK